MSVTLSLASDGQFLIHIPGVGAGNYITVPATVRGLEIIQRMLQAREEGERRIGTVGDPIQYLVDAWLREGNMVKRETMELDLEGIDL